MLMVETGVSFLLLVMNLWLSLRSGGKGLFLGIFPARGPDFNLHVSQRTYCHRIIFLMKYAELKDMETIYSFMCAFIHLASTFPLSTMCQGCAQLLGILK